MCLNIAADDASKRPDEVVYLAGGCASDCVGNTDSIYASAIDSSVEVQKVYQVGPEAIFAAETDFDTAAGNLVSVLSIASHHKHPPHHLSTDDVPLDVGNDFEGSLLNVVHVLAMGVLAELLGGANDDVHAVNSCVTGELGILWNIGVRELLAHEYPGPDSPP